MMARPFSVRSKSVYVRSGGSMQVRISTFSARWGVRSQSVFRPLEGRGGLGGADED